MKSPEVICGIKWYALEECSSSVERPSERNSDFLDYRRDIVQKEELGAINSRHVSSRSVYFLIAARRY